MSFKKNLKSRGKPFRKKRKEFPMKKNEKDNPFLTVL